MLPNNMFQKNMVPDNKNGDEKVGDKCPERKIAVKYFKLKRGLLRDIDIPYFHGRE